MLHQVNSYVCSFKSVLKALPQDGDNNYKIVINADRRSTHEYPGRYNVPSTNEVAVVLVDQEYDAVQLWEKYKEKFAEDFLWNISHNDEGAFNDNFRDFTINLCLLALQEDLTVVGGKSLYEYGLPTPTSVEEVTNREYSAEIGYNSMELLATLENGVPMMTAEQRSVYDRVCESVQNNLGTIWFLDATKVRKTYSDA
ncbi:unnamed protein product [Parnassius apollo]|uniref:(apollo) hypothetical protein n=1 Tax=Parnassius apollo TaxID=110799 RepID=A0A8S3XG58_PARAO|nr:unnamed protein product [Parnassius apollo]